MQEQAKSLTITASELGQGSQEQCVELLRNCLQVLVLATSNAQLPPPAGPREDLIEAATTPFLFMALYSLVRAFFEAPRERAPDFV